jgi:ribokinase
LALQGPLCEGTNSILEPGSPLWARLPRLRGGQHKAHVVVAGSVNADIIIEVQNKMQKYCQQAHNKVFFAPSGSDFRGKQVDRLPNAGETLTSRNSNSGRMIPGGKGANQAVAISRLLKDRSVKFACQFGNDAHAKALEQALKDNKLDLSACGHSKVCPSGQGYVLLEKDGSVSSIVVGGANVAWPSKMGALEDTVSSAAALMLQCEVPAAVNEALAAAAAQKGVPVILDVGGEDRAISDALMKQLTYISLNLSELQRLTSMPASSEDQIIAAAKSLLTRGARNVLVTMGDKGSLVLRADGKVLKQRCCPVPGGKVVDSTAAGDAYRAAFVCGLVEEKALEECMQLGSAAGALCVARLGEETYIVV